MQLCYSDSKMGLPGSTSFTATDGPLGLHWFPAPCDICDDFVYAESKFKEAEKVANMHFDNEEEEKRRTMKSSLRARLSNGYLRARVTHSLSRR